jgi:hypothetical protein
MDASMLEKHLSSLGYLVQHYIFPELYNRNILLSGKTILYTFSQKENVRQYIRNIIFNVSKTNTVIPSVNLLLCHENKGYQEFYKRELGMTRRHTRKGDFRASGTKKFDFDFTPDNVLLEFASKTAQRFNTPFLSMDIIQNEKTCYLIEYQVSHFGISAITKSRGYYIRESDPWTFREDKQTVEREITEVLDQYLTRGIES